MYENRPQSEEAWHNGYYRGIKESSETWANIIYEFVEDADLAYDILEQASRELGLTGKPGSSTAR